jgi:CNT family concentrative nucleoside transporter
MDLSNLISLLGIFGLLVLTWLISTNRRIINWRMVIWGLVLPLLFAFFIFRVPAGITLFTRVNSGVIKVLSFAKEGMYFLFGPLAVSPGEEGPGGLKSLGFILAFQALPTIIFFSALMALLYYIGLMPLLVKGFSYLFTKLMRVSGAESLYVASNIFVGVESAFTVRPYIEKMTPSELCTILTMGMGSVASTVLAFYTALLEKQFPMIAGHLVSASILAAPISILVSKLMLPEEVIPPTLGKVVKEEYQKPDSWIESIIVGANEGVKLCVGICALLLAFLGLLALVNWILGAGGNWIGSLIGISLNLSLQNILGYILYPLTWLMGVPAQDVPIVSTLLGQRAIVTEAVSYQHLSAYISGGGVIQPRSIVIATYALCGFAHIASLAIFVGGTAALVPSRARDLACVGLRALAAATLTCLIMGAIAGLFYQTGNTILFSGH